MEEPPLSPLHRFSSYSPTIFPSFVDFSAEATYMRTYVEAGYIEKIIAALVRMTNKQRQELAFVYERRHGTSLLEDLYKHSLLESQPVVGALLLTPDIHAAEEVHANLKNPVVILELLYALTNTERRALRRAYSDLYKTGMAYDLSKAEDSQEVRSLILALAKAKQSDSLVVKKEEALEDASTIFEAAKKGLSRPITEIFASRSREQMELTLEQFRALTKDDLEPLMQARLKTKAGSCLLILTAMIRCKEEKFAEWIYECQQRATHESERALVRLIIGRAEKDLENIKTAYLQKYKKSLEESIRDMESLSSSTKEGLLLVLKGTPDGDRLDQTSQRSYSHN